MAVLQTIEPGSETSDGATHEKNKSEVLLPGKGRKKRVKGYRL